MTGKCERDTTRSICTTYKYLVCEYGFLAYVTKSAIESYEISFANLMHQHMGTAHTEHMHVKHRVFRSRLEIGLYLVKANELNASFFESEMNSTTTMYYHNKTAIDVNEWKKSNSRRDRKNEKRISPMKAKTNLFFIYASVRTPMFWINKWQKCKRRKNEK